MTFTIADRGVVDHRIKSAQVVDARGHFLGSGDAIEVALDNRFGSGQGALRIIGAGSITGVQDDPMTLLDE